MGDTEMALESQVCVPRGEAPTGTQSIRRTVDVLREIATYNLTGIRLVDITNNLGLERSTAHRILQCLVYENLVREKQPGNRYVLGPLAFELGLSAGKRFDVASIFEPYMKAIADDTGDVLFLSVRSDLAFIYTARVDGNFPLKPSMLNVGHRRPLGFGAAGAAMLSLLPDNEVSEILIHNERSLLAYGGTTIDVAFDRVRKARTNGYATHERRSLGLKAIAVPIAEVNGRPAVVLSLSALASRMTEQHQRLLIESLQRHGAAAAAEYAACKEYEPWEHALT
jgi:DNA-binding IclR family transcriptional regulator